jgi:hypothetical protein
MHKDVASQAWQVQRPWCPVGLRVRTLTMHGMQLHTGVAENHMNKHMAGGARFEHAVALVPAYICRLTLRATWRWRSSCRSVAAYTTAVAPSAQHHTHTHMNAMEACTTCHGHACVGIHQYVCVTLCQAAALWWMSCAHSDGSPARELVAVPAWMQSCTVYCGPPSLSVAAGARAGDGGRSCADRPRCCTELAVELP